MTKKYWPLLTAIGVYWTTVFILIKLSINLNQGHLIYPLDDTYIHMAIAKNAAIHQVWGVTKYEFMSATSSPLWTALLAFVYFIFGVNELAPLILNLLFGTLAVIVAHSILMREVDSPLITLAILLFAIFAAPLPTITITGMEHVLQILITLGFVHLSSLHLFNAKEQTLQNNFLLSLLTLLVGIVRYEGLFPVITVCILLLLQKRMLQSVKIGMTALLPITLYGIWSITHGWFFLPNSILIKGNFPDLSLAGIATLLISGSIKMLLSGPLLWLLIASFVILLFIYRNNVNLHVKGWYANLIFIATVLLHTTFSSTGWLYRYEAYIMFIGVIIVGISLHYMLQTIYRRDAKRNKASSFIAIIIFAIIIPFGNRIFTSLQDTPQATHDRFLEHIQIAQFIREYYNDSVVVLNDIGAVGYYTDARIIDIYGLGSIEPYMFRRELDGYSKQDVYNWTKDKGAQIAFLQIQWIEIQPRVPDEWEMIVQWEIPQNVIFNDTKFGMYAVDPTAREELIHNLQMFETKRPSELKQIFLQE